MSRRTCSRCDGKSYIMVGSSGPEGCPTCHGRGWTSHDVVAELEAENGTLREVLEAVTGRLETFADFYMGMFMTPDASPLLKNGREPDVINVIDADIRRAREVLDSTPKRSKDGT